MSVSPVSPGAAEWAQVAAQNVAASSSMDSDGDKDGSPAPLPLPQGSSFSTYA